MAHLFTPIQGEWAAAPLEADSGAVLLTGDSSAPLRACREEEVGSRGPILYRVGGGVTSSGRPDAEKWAILCDASASVRVNGLACASGLNVLGHKDQIWVAGLGSFFFGAEDRPRVESFPYADANMKCARCSKPISQGVLVVRCPRCGAWHHQFQELPCWTYAPTCAIDDFPTDLEADFVWTPNDL